MDNQNVPSRYGLPDLFNIFVFKGKKYSDMEALLENVPALGTVEVPARLKDTKTHVDNKQDIFGYLEYGANLFILKYLKETGVLQISFCNFCL